MSKNALAGAYAQMLTNTAFRHSFGNNPRALDNLDLTQDEKAVLLAEAQLKDTKVAIGSGPVMAYLTSKRGPPLPPALASTLGIALNRAAGLPLGALTGPGFLTNAACCPWGHSIVGAVMNESMQGRLR